MTAPSRASIDRLGDRLRNGDKSAEAFADLAQYEASFQSAFDLVYDGVLAAGYSASGRYPKTHSAVVAKLRRGSSRLSQIDDIAGLRLVVRDIREQNDAINILRDISPNRVRDRRKTPSYGYRAVHMIFDVAGMPVEVQVRTELQHAWAQLSEKIADLEGLEIKYGGGSEAARGLLAAASAFIQTIEEDQPALSARKEAIKAPLMESLRAVVQYLEAVQQAQIRAERKELSE